GERVGVLVSDQRMPGMSGIELLAEAATRWPNVSRLLLTAYSDRDLLLAAIQRGHVHDYVLKPWSGDDLSIRLRRALDRHHERARLERSARERDLYKQELEEQIGFAQLVGLGGGLAALGARLEKIAASDST